MATAKPEKPDAWPGAGAAPGDPVAAGHGKGHASVDASQHNAYSFEVNLWATKEQIKHAVQELFSVRVEKVRTQMRLGKKRRFRFKLGKLSNWKKAIVTLHPEDKIEFF